MTLRLILLLCLNASVFSYPLSAASQEASETAASPAVAHNPAVSAVFADFEGWIGTILTEGTVSEGLYSKDVIAKPGAAADTARASGVVSSPALAPIKVEWPNANYQGMHVAIAVLDAGSGRLATKPLHMGFKNGDRFKVRVLTTFPGDLKIENITPKWVRKPVYPVDGSVRLEAGKEMIIPAGADEYFEFARTKGEDRLVITVRDYRATDKNVSHGRIFRKDEDSGSNFIQEVFAGSYPIFSEVVKLKHF